MLTYAKAADIKFRACTCSAAVECRDHAPRVHGVPPLRQRAHRACSRDGRVVCDYAVSGRRPPRVLQERGADVDTLQHRGTHLVPSPRRPPAGGVGVLAGDQGVSVGLACATSRFLPPPQKHHQMGCFGSGLACIRVGALQNYFLPPPPFPVGALSTVPVGLATRICFSGLGYNSKYPRSRKAALRGGRPFLRNRYLRKTQQTLLLNQF